MENTTFFLSTLLITSFVIQFGNLILDKTNFIKTFKMISGILLLLTIINSVDYMSFQKFQLSDCDLPDYTNNDFDIKQNFEDNLITAIKSDLHKIGYVNITVDVDTNFETLKIYVYGIEDEKSALIHNYLKNKYCTSDDEVIIGDKSKKYN